MNDPRLPLLVSITRVSVSADLRHATVYVSIMDTGTDKRPAVDMLQAAEGFLRRELKPRLALRYVPSLAFSLDESIEHGTRMIQIMDTFQTPSEQPE